MWEVLIVRNHGGYYLLISNLGEKESPDGVVVGKLPIEEPEAFSRRVQQAYDASGSAGLSLLDSALNEQYAGRIHEFVASSNRP